MNRTGEGDTGGSRSQGVSWLVQSVGARTMELPGALAGAEP